MKTKEKKNFKEVFGRNPWDPWSIKHGIAEASGLDAFLKSRGMNPKTMDREKKSAWARSDAFKNWARNRPVSSSTYQYKTASEEFELEENKLLDKPTLTPEQIAKKHKVSLEYVKKQLKLGIEIEKEHTSDPAVAKEIALDHLGERPDYYQKLKKYVEEVELDEGSLHDWFGKEKWVRMDTKGNIKGKCARDPGEGKPKCLPQAKAHALGKEKRAAAARRKRREDPNPSRSGKAVNVRTEEVEQIDEDINEKWSKEYKDSINCSNPKGFSQKAHCAGKKKNESVQEETLDEKKDACYHKVKSRYKVWPSAYASGALVKCRKRGAKNWGTKSEQDTGELHKSNVHKHVSDLAKRVHVHKPQKTVSTEQLQVEPSESVLHDEPQGTLTKVMERKRQMTKAARIIKSIYKRHRVTEDLYDHEKDNKDPARVKGKTPKLEKADKDSSIGENKPQAAAVLRGGKTMTGQDRDTVEIDPMMRNRPGQPDVTKKEDKDKKDSKKNKDK